jgi:transcriptional regulator GlxA family with amidase domain
MKTVQILIFEGVDELDVTGVYETLASCRTVVNGHWSDKAAFHVEVVAEHRTTVECAHGMKICADRSLSGAVTSDIVIIPGGPGARRSNLPTHILEYVDYSHQTALVVASVSTGAFITARAGLTDGFEVVTHHAQADTLAKMYPKTKVIRDQRVVISGRQNNLMSCGGISAGIDLALCLIHRCEGQQTAVLAGKRLEWPGYYDPHNPHHIETPAHFAMKPAPALAKSMV